MNIFNITLIVIIIIYFVLSVRYFMNTSRKNKALDGVAKKEISLFFWEKWIIEKTDIDKSYVKAMVYGSRALFVFILLVLSYMLGAIALTLVTGFIIVMFMERKAANLIHEAGIDHIQFLNAFLDSYIPSLSSGLSNDQAMLKFINAEDDDSLFEWWVNKDSNTYKPEIKWKRVIEVYTIIRFNEDRGIDNSLPIIEDMQKGINIKQQFYNEYSAKMGEVQPIMLSYYIFVPVLLFISFNETKAFWFSIWGYVSAIALILLFVVSQFLIYKVKEATTKTIF